LRIALSATRATAAAFGLGRALFGAAYLAAPKSGARGWIGEEEARRGATQMVFRSLGARDFVLGAGAATAAVFAEDDSSPATWLFAHAVSDAADVAGSFAAAGSIPERGRQLGMAIAAGSAVVSLSLAVALSR
jgi:hypothetical protein